MTRSAVALVRLAAPLSSSTTDAELLRAFLAASGKDSFAELVHRHGPMVLAVCRRVLSNRHDAEDAFQAVFLVLARKAGTIRGTNLAGWLYGVAVRTARGVRIMRDRRRKREQASGGCQPAVPESPTDFDTARIIDDELAKLPEHYRDALVVCELRGLSRKDAARELGIPEGTLSSRLAAAKKRLGERLAARGVTGVVVLAATLPSAAVSAALQEATALAVRGTASSIATAAAATVLKGMLFDQLKGVVLAAGLLLTGVFGFAMTASPDAPPGTNPPVPVVRRAEDPAAALVRQLGSEDFATRESAGKKLRELGAKSETALRAGLKSDNPEVRARSARILAAIRTDALDALVKNFEPKADKQPDHPIWKRFKAIAGDTLASRELFARIIKNPDWLRRLDAAEAGPVAAAKQYSAAMIEVGRTLESYKTVWFRIYVWPGDPANQAAYLLLLGSYPGTEKATLGDSSDPPLFDAGERQLVFARGLALGLQGKEIAPGPKRHYDVTAALPEGSDRVFAKLLGAWLPRRTDAAVLYHGFELAVKHRAEEVLVAARTVANDKDRGVKARCAALQALAQFGTRADLPLFEPLFDDDTALVVPPPTKPGVSPGPRSRYLHVHDQALALALLLCDQDPFELRLHRREGSLPP